MSAPPTARRRTLRLSVVEGTFWALMVGVGEAYFVADAVRMGAPAWMAAVVSVLPMALGTLGAPVAVRLLEGGRARKGVVVAGVVAQGCALLGLSLATFALDGALPLLLLGAFAYQFSGQLAGPAWSSWMGDVVPPSLRGRYFGGRNRWIHGATFVGLMTGGSWLQLGPLEGAQGFAAMYALAALLRFVSAGLIAASWEPERSRGSKAITASLPWSSEEARVARTIAWRASLLLGGTTVASPFFGPWMLQDLQFSYLQYAAAQAAMVAGKVGSLRWLGRLVDRGGAAGIWTRAALGVSLVPLPWLWVETWQGALFIQAFSGLCWAAIEVSQTALLYHHSPKDGRAVVFAGVNARTGMAQGAGTTIGVVLAHLGTATPTLFVLSSAMRVVGVVWGLRWEVPDAGPNPLRGLVLRLGALRPHGGPRLRPELLTNDETEER